MKKQKILLQLAVLFAIVFGFSQASIAQSRIDRMLISEAKRITNDNFTVFTETPNGARVYAASQPSAKMLNAIDQGLSDLFAVAKKNNYSRRTNYSDYTIFIAKADRTKDINKNYSPDIAVASGQYSGSVYDQGGFIYAAGMVIAHNPCAFVIAEHERNLERVSDVVRFEGEHLVLYHNDRRRYRETSDHSQGGGHPILN